MLIQGGYRWISTKTASVMGRRVDLSSGEGFPVSAGKATRIGRKSAVYGFFAADLAAKKAVDIRKKLGIGRYAAKDIAVARAMRMSRIPLAAYRVLPITVVKNLVMGRFAVGESFPTKTGMSKWAMPMVRTAVGKNFSTRGAEVRRKMRTSRIAVLDCCVGHRTDTQSVTGMMCTPFLDGAGSSMFVAGRSMRTRSFLSAATWGDPELLEDGTLLIRQAYRAEVIDGILEVR